MKTEKNRKRVFYENTENVEGKPMELTKKLLEIERLLTGVEMDIEKVWAMCGALDQRHFEEVKGSVRLSLKQTLRQWQTVTMWN